MKTIRIFFSALFLTAIVVGCSDPMDEFTPTKYGDSGGPIMVQSEQASTTPDDEGEKGSSLLEVNENESR